MSTILRGDELWALGGEGPLVEISNEDEDSE